MFWTKTCVPSSDMHSFNTSIYYFPQPKSICSFHFLLCLFFSSFFLFMFEVHHIFNIYILDESFCLFCFQENKMDVEYDAPATTFIQPEQVLSQNNQSEKLPFKRRRRNMFDVKPEGEYWIVFCMT